MPAPDPGLLVHSVHLAGDVRVEVDLTEPGRWRTVTAPSSDAVAAPLLRAVTDGCPTGAPDRRALAGSLPWLRVAVVDALDRWLHTPLRQSLVDAERGVVRGRAARGLPHGPARAVLTGEAVRLARRSSRDVVKVLRRLGRIAPPVPAALHAAVETLVDGYAELADDVSGPDRELLSVLDGWRRLPRAPGAAHEPTATTSADVSAPCRATHDRATYAIDPRQVRARVLALSADPAAPEIAITGTDGDDVVVRVPAFGGAVDRDVAARLLVRLVDRRSGEANGHALLRTSDTTATWFEAAVPRYGADVANVRVDVADALSDVAPAADDADEALCEARRAVVFLAEWRRLVGLAQLGAPTATAGRLRELAARLEPGRARTDAGLFTGGPSRAELEALADLGDDGLSARLRGDGAMSEGLRGLTAGPAALLVAELAALILPPAA